MATSKAESQVSIDDILEYTSNNEVQTPEEEAAQLRELAEEVPADLFPQLFTPDPSMPALNPYAGHHPNTNLYAINKAQLSARAGHQFMPLTAPTPAMLAAAANPEISELIPQDHPEWQNLRSGKLKFTLSNQDWFCMYRAPASSTPPMPATCSCSCGNYNRHMLPVLFLFVFSLA